MMGGWQHHLQGRILEYLQSVQQTSYWGMAGGSGGMGWKDQLQVTDEVTVRQMHLSSVSL